MSFALDKVQAARGTRHRFTLSRQLRDSQLYMHLVSMPFFSRSKGSIIMRGAILFAEIETR